MNKELFLKELKKINIEISKKELSMLDEYYHILVEENQKYNLTSITEKDHVYLKHFYDSLTISKIIDLKEQSLCDIGTGAGFPGLVLKILFPDLDITLVEATEKRCKFLQLVVDKLNLKKVTIINERAEIYSKNTREKFDIVTSRAVAPLKHLLEYSIPLVKVEGLYIAMKGNIEKEIININNYYKKLDIEKIKQIQFRLPIEESVRTLIMYKKNKKTSLIYPRKYNDIKKKDI